MIWLPVSVVFTLTSAVTLLFNQLGWESQLSWCFAVSVQHQVIIWYSAVIIRKLFHNFYTSWKKVQRSGPQRWVWPWLRWQTCTVFLNMWSLQWWKCWFTGLATVEAYNAKANEWFHVNPMNTRRSSVGVGVVGG